MALEQIIAHKKMLIKKNREQILQDCQDLKPSSKSFYEALKQKHCSFIFEIKPASPSEGLLKSDVDVCAIAKTYGPFADAISVLADEKFFLGSLDNVLRVSKAQNRPILCKDVVVSPLQVLEARAHGADAVLLMLSVLSDQEYQACEKLALSLNMAVVCEVHTEQEMLRAKALQASIIDINNRNLFNLKIELDTTKKLAPLAPKDALLISASGFKKRSELMKYAHLVDSFLVGSSLMKSKRIDLAMRELLFGRIKICGLTNASDAKMAYDAGAFYGGLNFWPQSKRYISLDEAQKTQSGAPLKWGGVFVAKPVAEVTDIALQLKLDYVQLHGDESDEYMMDLKKLLPDVEIWQVIRVQDTTIKKSPQAERVLLDTYCETELGGTGKSFAWGQHQGLEHMIIAGGINPLNILEAATFEPYAIDICSGVEESPRHKSQSKMAAIFSNLRPKAGHL